VGGTRKRGIGGVDHAGVERELLAKGDRGGVPLLSGLREREELEGEARACWLQEKGGGGLCRSGAILGGNSEGEPTYLTYIK
jgi:hypothetical protein